jgi:hypothetical protein
MLPTALSTRNYVIKCWAAPQMITAVGTLVVPRKMDLITGGAPGDQARLINVMLFH